MVVFFVAFYTAPFSSKHFFIGHFIRSLSTQLCFLVVLLLLLLSMTAFFSLLIATFSRSLPEPSSTQLLSWGIVFSAVCRARIRSLVSFCCSGLFFGLPIFGVSVLSNLQGPFDILSSFGVCVCGGGGGGGFLGFSLCSDSDDFSYSEGSVFVFFSGISHASSTMLFFFLVLFFLAALHCLLRMHALNSCVGDTWQRFWPDDITHNGKRVVNRLKIPQGLSTPMFRRWSEVPSRGGVSGDSP